MTDTTLSSDPHAWLRTYWARLHHQQQFFPNLAPELKLAALAEAVEADYPVRAAEIRAWTPVATRAVLASLDRGLAARRTSRDVVLWSADGPAGAIRCIARYLPTGIDLRLSVNRQLLRTHLFADGASALGAARQWRTEHQPRTHEAPTSASATPFDAVDPARRVRRN